MKLNKTYYVGCSIKYKISNFIRQFLCLFETFIKKINAWDIAKFNECFNKSIEYLFTYT